MKLVKSIESEAKLQTREAVLESYMAEQKLLFQRNALLSQIKQLEEELEEVRKGHSDGILRELMGGSTELSEVSRLPKSNASKTDS